MRIQRFRLPNSFAQGLQTKRGRIMISEQVYNYQARALSTLSNYHFLQD